MLSCQCCLIDSARQQARSGGYSLECTIFVILSGCLAWSGSNLHCLFVCRICCRLCIKRYVLVLSLFLSSQFVGVNTFFLSCNRWPCIPHSKRNDNTTPLILRYNTENKERKRWWLGVCFKWFIICSCQSRCIVILKFKQIYRMPLTCSSE